jgi:vitamin B12 transporter
MTSSVLRRTKVTVQPLAIALSVSAAFSPFSFAQTAAETSLAPVLVTASRTAQKASNVLADNIVITAEEIAASGQTSLVDLLQTKRGLEIKRNGGAGNSADVYIRGANGKQTILLIDGVRSVSSTLGTPTWSTIPLSQVDRIEIVMGPLSTFYGADAVSGVIQIFTKKGNGPPQVSFSAGAGTYGEQVVTAGVAGSTEGEHRIRYAINATQEEADGFSSALPTSSTYNPDDDGYQKQSVSGQFSFEFAKGQEIGLSFLNSKNEAQYDNGKVSTYDTHILSYVDVYSLYLRNQITANWTSFLQGSRSYNKEGDYKTPVAAQTNSMQDQLTWQNDFKIGDDLLQVLVERKEESVFSSTQSKLNRDRSTDSLALAYQLHQGAHLGSASVRYDDSSAYGSNVTGSLGYGYHVTNELRLSGSLGTSFRAPTYNELYFSNFGNPNAKPEKGQNTEIGVYYDDSKSNFNISYYHNKITDLLVSRNPCPAGPSVGTSCVYNVNKALLTGVSIGAGTKLGNFNLYSNLDLQDPRDETNDKLLERRSTYHGSLGLNHKLGAVTSGADIVFSGYRYDAANETKRMGGYTLLNLHASYDLTDNWQLFGRWNNVFDKFYELAQTYQTPGSNAFVGLRYGFN